MRTIVVTTTQYDEKGKVETGKQIIKEIVPAVMQKQADPNTVGWLVQSRINRYRPKGIKVRIGYDDGRFLCLQYKI